MLGKVGGALAAFGVATKRYPSMDDWAFFSDKEEDYFVLIKDLRKLYELSKTSTLVFPVAGLGTGLSKMQLKSPHLYIEMMRILREHFNIYNDEE
jgi:hypothetical protein